MKSDDSEILGMFADHFTKEGADNMEQEHFEHSGEVLSKEVFFRQLFEENYQKLINFICYAYLKVEVKTAEDIVQDTFVEAMNKYDQIVHHPNPGGWLMNTARFKLSTTVRRAYQSDVSYDDCTVEPSYSDAQYGASELEVMIDTVLTAQEKELFIKYFVEQHPSRQMAQEQNMTENAFKVKMHRIRKKLQDQLQ